ncbi:hypothetical protein E4U32_003963, partial [Claviceps aff. humidiphila group G2b]
VEDVSAQLKEWELDSQEDLKMLGALIDKIITVVKGCDGRGILRYDVATGSLIISRDEGDGRMLPEDLYSKWDEVRRIEPKMSQSLWKQLKKDLGIKICGI